MHMLLIGNQSDLVPFAQELLLEEEPFTVEVAPTERLQAGTETPVNSGLDAMLLDLASLDGPSLDMVRTWRALAPDVPVIVLIGPDNEQIALQAIHEGAQDYLVKGRFDRDRLLHTLRCAIERKRAEVERGRQYDEMERARREWGAVVAHDLRQPLSAISIYVALLNTFAHERGAGEDAEQAARRIDTSLERINRLVGDLMDVSLVEAGRLHLERRPLDLPSIIREASSPFAESAPERPVRIITPTSVPLVMGDRVRLEQIIVNLLSNAIKYGEPSTEILLEIAASRGEVRVAVSNRGPGITPDQSARLFSRFHRTEAARTREAPGLGLGLYICKGLIEAHGGRIGAQSVPGETTTFWFTLPLDPIRAIGVEDPLIPKRHRDRYVEPGEGEAKGRPLARPQPSRLQATLAG